jgi:hypothetical protein
MPDSIEDMLFMQSACDYYVAARFAMHAQSVPLVGILFHHAVERFLKAGHSSFSGYRQEPSQASYDFEES